MVKKNSIKTKILILFIVAVSLFATAHFAMAQNTDFGLNYANNVGLGGGDSDPRVVAVRILQLILTFLGIIAVVIIMYAGWLWMTSQGDEEKIRKAKQTLINAIIGMIIIMCAFLIVSWVLNNLGPDGQRQQGGINQPGTVSGYGAIGSCSVETVYPEVNQKEVARNTSIIVTFKEDINPQTVCQDTNNNGTYCDCVGANCDRAITGGDDPSVKIFYRNETDSCVNGTVCNSLVADLIAVSNDNRTFVFIPANYLGSPSEYIWYSVYISNAVENSGGQGIFAHCSLDYLLWSFEVSNRIDLDPPQVLQSGIFPPPDNEQDVFTASASARASGNITVNSQPLALVKATASINAPVSGLEIISINERHNQSGNLTLAVEQDAKTISLSGSSGPLGASTVGNNNTVVFSSFFTLRLPQEYTAGQSWSIAVTPFRESDILTVGSIIYSFVPAGATNLAVGQIPLGGTTAITAQNISNVINGTSDSPANPSVSANYSGNMITIIAKIAGAVGNHIKVSSNSSGLIVPLTGYLSDGKDQGVSVSVRDKSDKPKNSVIQINFNEAIMPSVVSGGADEVSDRIRVVNNNSGVVHAGEACSTNSDCLSYDCSAGVCRNDYLSGKFVISNVYKTVEFISSNICGVNGCGEEIYCLPENSNLRVELNAANLIACSDNNDCLPFSPYNVCESGHCRSDSLQKNYPMSSLNFDGIMDAARNSLDGDRSEEAEGPVEYYNENNWTGSGDNYSWSFFISNVLDASSPQIESISPDYGQNGVSQIEPVKIQFNKVMMNSSLATGIREVSVNNGTVVRHKNINLWNLNNLAVGYWIASEGINSDSGASSELDKTAVEIRHTDFGGNTGVRTQIGSGVRDVYQNCYKPSAGPGCSANSASPSCCDGSSTADLDAEGNCL
ncbi:MAG: pilin [bacterium]